jgi:ribonucleoside-diphosphate reductase alpha chain
MSKKVVLSDNAESIAKKRYFKEGEDWEGLANRVSDAVSAPEVNNKDMYRQAFGEMIYDMDFLPAGRILRNAGKTKGSLFNCYHLPVGDSREEIGQCLKDSLILWGEGGGVGYNFSTLRQKGAPIRGVGGTSSGLVSFITATNALADTVKSGGGRRAAALASVDVSHPEVLDFIDAKLLNTSGDNNPLSNFNISVIVNGDFLQAVESDKDWHFKFAGQTYGSVKARFIWDKIITNMITSGEPGLLNWDKFKKNNSYSYDPVTGCNPCGEATLSPYDVCNLGSLVLPNFITGTKNTNWKKLESTIKLAVRFLDNVIDVNNYTLKDNDIKAHNSRRIGVGVMGLAEYLFAKEIRYGSPQSLHEIERLMKFIRDCIYSTLVELASEKGTFAKYDAVAYSKASFIRKLPANIRSDIKKYGSRCVTGLAIAPTGTISMIPEVSSSIEPLYAKAYVKSDEVGSRNYIHPKLVELLRASQEVPDWFVDVFDLKPEDHLDVQSVVQKFVDGAVSKTINMPAGTQPEELDKLLLEYINDLKGVTVYVDGSKTGQPFNKIEIEDIKKMLDENDAIETSLEEEDITCASGSCNLT